MKKIRKFTYYIMLFSIVLGACGSQDKADAEQLDQINEQVERLYNKEMNDFAEEVSVESFEEVEESIEAINEADLNEENAKTFEEIEASYSHAVEMFELEEGIHALFVENVVVAEVQLEDLAEFSTRLAEINPEKWTGYVPRQEEKLAEAEQQLGSIKVAKELVDKLYLDEDQVNREVTREEESIAKEAVALVKNETIRADLEKRLAKVEEEYKEAIEGVGFFEGMYLSYDNFILYIDEKQHLVAENEASDNLAYFEVTEIINNSGKELTLGLYQEPIPAFDIAGGNSRETFYLSDDYNTVITERGFEFRRLNQKEIDAIFDNLNGLQEILARNTN